MKKRYRLFLSFCLCVLFFMFTAFHSMALTTDSLFKNVENACDLIYDTQLEYNEVEKQNAITNKQSFSTTTIAIYTFFNIDEKYKEGFGNKDFYGSYSTYKISTKNFEDKAKQLFSNVDINKLRADNRYYDALENAYVFDVGNYSDGWGAIDDCALVGYKENNGIYTFYGYLGTYWIPDEYLEDVKNLKNFNDTIKINNFEGVRIDSIRYKEEKHFNISKRFKTTISFENDTIKFLSWEITDSLPSTDDLVTIHSVSNNSFNTSSSANSSTVQSQTSSSAQASVSNSSNATQSKPNNSSQKHTSTISSEPQNQSSISPQISVSNSSNAIQSKPNSSSQTHTSTISSEPQNQSSISTQISVSNSSNAIQSKPNSSLQTNTSTISSEIQNQSSSSEKLEEIITSNSSVNDITNVEETTIEKVDNKNKHNINKFWVVMSGVAVLIAIGTVTTIVLIKRKKSI